MLVLRRPTQIAVGLAILVFAGCGSREAPLVPVEGILLQAGRPVVGAQVVFCPDREAGAKGPRSFGTTDKDGRFKLATDEGADGAVSGPHRVVVFLNAGSEVDENPAPRKTPVSKSSSKEYSSYYRTPLRVEVTPPAANVTVEMK